MNIKFSENKVFSDDSPVELVAGVTETFSCTYWGAVTSVTAVAYKRKKDVSATVFPSGSISTSGAVATLRPLTALTVGTYVVTVTGTVGGSIKVKKLQVNVQKAEVEA